MQVNIPIAARFALPPDSIAYVNACAERWIVSARLQVRIASLVTIAMIKFDSIAIGTIILTVSYATSRSRKYSFLCTPRKTPVIAIMTIIEDDVSAGHLIPHK